MTNSLWEQRIARGHRASATLASLLMAGSLLAGCASAKKASPAASPPVTAAAASSPATTAHGPVTVTTRSGSLGSYLTDGSGRALYLFAADPAGRSSCSGACAQYWPPLTAAGTPRAQGAVQARLLSTIARSDGSRQVSYDGHPLYYFVRDSAPGSVTGEGNDGFGAKWWLVSPSGQAITGATAPSATSSSTTSSSATSSSATQSPPTRGYG